MKISTFSILIASLSMMAIWIVLTRLKKDRVGIRSAATWTVLWFGIGFFCLFPGLLDAAMRFAQMKNRMFFILVSAVFVLFALVFNLASRMDRMQRDISRLIQEIALLNYKVDSSTPTESPRASRKEIESHHNGGEDH
ncbi:MAG: DUF2304 domain-containing protein [Thermodesulfobacteriota bacterium]|nr:DUF2304 domain-containing protein [Thermodesulfobacteriota bacterium]